MKLMSKLLLINWHYFSRELIEFGRLNFLTGKNASGKSTIIDALQVVLLGDTSGSFFNKAASGKGGRSLKGYLLGELGDDEDAGFRSLRGGKRFTSYIALEFFDTDKKKYFTAGCCFDVYSENDYPVKWFIYNGEIPANTFLRDDIPLDRQGLRDFLKGEYAGYRETTTGKDFREDLCGRLGGLRVERFRNLLKKAVSFNPDVKIQSFISEFVCDEQQAVDVTPMQETIRSYKLLEHEADVLNERIALLTKIVDTHSKYKTAQENERMYSYLIARADKEAKDNQLSKEEAHAVDLTEKLSQLQQQIGADEAKLQKLTEERDVLNAQLLNNKSEQQLKELDRKIADIRMQITRIQEEFANGLRQVSAIITGWKLLANEMIQKVRQSREISDAGLALRIEDLCQEAEKFLQKINGIIELDAIRIQELGTVGFAEIDETADRLRTHSIELNSRLRDEQDSLAKQKAILQAELGELKQGINPFPRDVLDLKEAILSHLRLKIGFDVKVSIVAEVSEIKNERWRNAIEGYMNTQKYYIIVAGEHFRDALRIYDKIKTTQRIYGTGIVDIEKLRKQNPVCDSNSLATEIETSDPDVRTFLDFVLGRVIKCDDVQALRQFRTSVTDDGMLYKNFVVRAMNPSTWSKPAIGQGAIQKRLLSVKAEMDALVECISAYSSIKIAIGSTSKMQTSKATEFENTVRASSQIGHVPALESDLKSLTQSRNTIDTSTIDALKKRIADLKGIIGEISFGLDQKKREEGKIEERVRALHEDTIPKLKYELHELEAHLLASFDKDWIEQTGSLRYGRELSQRKTPENIREAFPRELSKQKNLSEEAWENLCALRRTYNVTYKMGLNEKSPDNNEYDDLWLELSENSLPSFTLRIADAKKKAFEQFQEDFLSRLQNNIKTARRQIDELNSALRGCSFGEDTYRFKIIPDKNNERFYAMIMDEMYLQRGWNLMSEAFNDKYKTEISDLFSLITDEGGIGGKIGDYEKRVLEYTDYRTYLSFDLEVIHKDGTSERLSKTLSKKSGGETQTPFYIAVLASFVQLYRIGHDKSEKTSRLIIFDEAFSKMDSERIVRSIELLRKFSFQVILSAPPDKIGDIATLVDRNLLVYRDGKSTCVRQFDPRQIESILYD